MDVERRIAEIKADALAIGEKAAKSKNRLVLIELSAKLHNQVDLAVEAIQAENPRPACQVGCNFCCHGLIPVTTLELLELSEHIDSWTEDQKQALLERLGKYDAESKQYWRYDLHHFESPCPLLDEGRCSVYAHRPVFCRGKSSYDAEDCRQQMHGISVPLRVVPGQFEAG